MRELNDLIIPNLEDLLDNGTAVWLVAIEPIPGEAFFLTTNNEIVNFNSIDWEPFPMELGDFEDSGDGDLPASTLSVSNVNRIAMTYLEAGGWDQGDVVFVLVLLLGNTVQPVGLTLEYTMQAASANHQTVTLNIGQGNWFDRPFPSHLYLRSSGFPGIPRNQN